MSEKLRDEAIDRALDLLGEHFESVQILCSYNEDSQTKCVRKGCGNWYARIRMAQELVIEDDSRIHHKINQEEFGQDEA